jgi:iron complex transport system ATP-binding protein
MLGPNGAGKTTLLKCLLRKEKPQKGDIQLWGKSLDEYKQEELARLISYVPQEAEMPFSYKVFEVVMMGRYPHSSPLSIEGDKEIRLIHELLEKTGMDKFADRSFNELSSGEKQCVLLVRAMVQEAPLMLLDEPTSNLDIKHTTMLLQLIVNRQKETGQTLLFVTHDLNLASSLVDRLILIKNGMLLIHGTPADLLSKENIRELYDTEIRIITDQETGDRFFGYHLDRIT